MGIQVVYKMQDVLDSLRDNDEIKFMRKSHKDFNTKGNEVDAYYWQAWLNGFYIGNSINMQGTYWFDNENVNNDGREQLDNLKIKYQVS